MVTLDLETAQDLYNSISQIELYKRTYTEEMLLQFVIDKYGNELTFPITTTKDIEYKIGNWYIDATGHCLVNYQVGHNCYGFRFEKFIDTPWEFKAEDLKKLQYRKAPKAIVERLLIHEAKRRYKDGDKIESFMGKNYHTIQTAQRAFVDDNYTVHVSAIENEWEFKCSNPPVFTNGKWAKVIATGVDIKISEKKDSAYVHLAPGQETGWIDPSKIFHNEIKTDEEIHKHHLNSFKMPPNPNFECEHKEDCLAPSCYCKVHGSQKETEADEFLKTCDDITEAYNKNIKKREEEIAKHHLESSKEKKGFTWEDSFNNGGFYVNYTSEIVNYKFAPGIQSKRNVFKTEAQAKSALAFAQLTHIVAKYNEHLPVPPSVYYILNDSGQLKIVENRDITLQFPFYTKQDAEISLQINRELWEDFFMIEKHE